MERPAGALRFRLVVARVGTPGHRLEMVEHFDAVSQDVLTEKVTQVVNVSADLGRHLDWLHGYVELGFDQIALHHVGQEQRAFIDTFGEQVLPKLHNAE